MCIQSSVPSTGLPLQLASKSRKEATWSTYLCPSCLLFLCMTVSSVSPTTNFLWYFERQQLDGGSSTVSSFANEAAQSKLKNPPTRGRHIVWSLVDHGLDFHTQPLKRWFHFYLISRGWGASKSSYPESNLQMHSPKANPPLSTYRNSTIIPPVP